MGVGEKDSSRRSTRPESGRKLAKTKKKKNLLRGVRLILVFAGGIACDEQDGKGMIANDERERKKMGSRKWDTEENERPPAATAVATACYMLFVQALGYIMRLAR
jgi:hypothetical protein